MQNRVVLTSCSLWTGTGESPLENMTVDIVDGRIADVKPSQGATPSGDGLVIECGGRWVMPGLIDCHLHLWGQRSSSPVEWVTAPRAPQPFRVMVDGEKLLASGFTTVRDAGGEYGPTYRDLTESGEVRGPRVRASHLGMSRTGGHGDAHSLPIEWVRERPYMALIVDGADEIRKAVRLAARHGADWIKMWVSGAVGMSERDSPFDTHFSDEELRTACDEAHALNLSIGAHVYSPNAIRSCVEAGLDCVEHGFLMDEGSADLCAERGVSLVTTISLFHRYLRWEGSETVLTKEQKELARRLLPQIHDAAAIARRAGVLVGIGSDSFAEPLTPFGSSAEEITCLSQSGFSNYECLAAATCNAARIVGLAELVGTVEIGKAADLLVLGHASPEDDLSQVTNPGNIQVVLKNGEVVAGAAVQKRIALS